MDFATLSTSTFTLLKEGDTTPVEAEEFSCDDPCRTVTLSPNTDLGDATTYTATLKGGASGATDKAGNPLAEDKEWSFTTADTTAPQVALTAPEDGAAVRGTEVTLSAEATDNAAVDRVEFMVDGQKVGTDSNAENGNSYSVKWDATSISDGPRVIEARAYDTSSQAAFSTRTLIVDNTAPTGTVLVNGGARNTKSSDVSLTLSASDPEPGSGVRWVRFSNDGTDWSDWVAYVPSKEWTIPNLKGESTVYVQFQDLAGNESGVASDKIRRVSKTK
jgi:hypothetical protein